MRTVILSEGLPAKLTVQDLQSSHVKKCATSTQTAYLYALRPKLCHTFQNLAKNISQGQGCQKSPGSHRYRLLVASCWLRATGWGSRPWPERAAQVIWELRRSLEPPSLKKETWHCRQWLEGAEQRFPQTPQQKPTFELKTRLQYL